MRKRKTTRILTKVEEKENLGKPLLPYNHDVVREKGFFFSFARFDRNHELFCLGSNGQEKVVNSAWFLDLLDCFKDVSTKTVMELRNSSTYDLHPVNWSNANAKCPDENTQADFWQFRINKSKGRIIGCLIDHVFYITWLDRYHNFTDSEGYGGVQYFPRPKSVFEQHEEEIENLKLENAELRKEIEDFEELLSIM